MIAALMVYTVAITILFSSAAVAAERLLRLAHRPARFVWVAAMLAVITFSAARFQAGLAPVTQVQPVVSITSLTDTAAAGFNALSSNAGAVPVAATTLPAPSIAQRVRDRLDMVRIRISSGSTWDALDRPFLIGWVASSILGLAFIGLSALSLARSRPRWSTATVDGTPVLLSHDLGPAVIGLFRHRIVLPAWVLELRDTERDLILVHEREHAAAGDPSLLFIATVIVAFAPWNAPLWWMARRLRFAIELDCDARVLRKRPDRGAYGALLIDVSERALGGAMPIAALAEPVSLVERRITAMSRRMPRFALLRAIVAGAFAAALITAATAAPHPERAPTVVHEALPERAPARTVPTHATAQSHMDAAPPSSAVEAVGLTNATVAALMQYGPSGIINPMLMLLRDAESLGLSVPQADSIATINRQYMIRLNAIWAPVAAYYARTALVADARSPNPEIRRAPAASMALLIGFAPSITALLTDEQRQRLPSRIAVYLDTANLAAIGAGTSGGATGVFDPISAFGAGRRGRVGGPGR